MVDLSFLETFAKGNKEKMKRYIRIYLQIAPATFKDMEQHVADQDWEQLRIKAHSLKPQADYMGIPELKAVFVDIEEKVQAKNYANLNALFEQASDINTKAMPELKAFIDAV